MVEKLQKIWLEGEMIAWDEAQISILTHSMHYGLGAFEGIRCYKRKDGKSYIFRLKEHIDRLFDSCKLTLMVPRFTRDQVMTACSEILRANHLEEGYL
ncbi:MAG: aminotransferase class IV, partial [Polyangiaceae bacterium]